MLKWAVGQRNPTPGHLLSSNHPRISGEKGIDSDCNKTDRLHVARRRNNREAVKKAAVRSLKRAKHDKENQPCLVGKISKNGKKIYEQIIKPKIFFQTPENASSRTRDSSRSNQMVLRDVSNSPNPYTITPQRHIHIKRRQSHPLNLITKKFISEYSKSAPANTLEYIKSWNLPDTKVAPHFFLTQPTATSQTPKGQLDDSFTNITDTIDMRKPNSTIKSLLSMQIEYSPGPLTATQSLVKLRQRLTKTLGNDTTPQGIENPLYYALHPSEKRPNNGITLSCNEQSPTLEGLLEEKSIFDQVSDKLEFINNLKRENSKIENNLVSSLSQRLEWLRLNNNFSNVSLVKEGDVPPQDDQGIANDNSADNCIGGRKRKEKELLRRQKCIRRKIRKCDSARKTGKGHCCDIEKPNTQKPALMGLTLPQGTYHSSGIIYFQEKEA